jgi:hypothetical protein
MAQLTYWYCQCLDDSDAYSLVTKTKKEALAMLAERSDVADYYAPPEKRTIDYKDAFDLFYWATSEGGGRGCGSSVK